MASSTSTLFDTEMPTYRILNKETNQYFDAVLVDGKYYAIYYPSHPTVKYVPVSEITSEYIVKQNKGFPIPENIDEMLSLLQLNDETLSYYGRFLEFYEKFEEYKRVESSEYLRSIKRRIQYDSIFTTKHQPNNKMCSKMYEDVVDFMTCALSFKTFVDENEEKGAEKYEDITLYRFIGDNNETHYFPSFFSVDDVIPQYLPFSTSMQPEFPIYKWSDDYCCILKIIVKGGLYGKGIPISSNFSSNDRTGNHYFCNYFSKRSTI